MTHSVPELGEKFSHLWLDGLRRNQLEDGTLDKLVARSGIGGVSTAIGSRDRAIDDNEFYRAVISVCARYGETAEQIYERLNVEDAQAVADVLRPTYDATGCRDGYASLALSPFLAYTTADTIKDADRLWAAVDRPNLMISVPATDAGVAAIPALIARGINVRVTLLFSRSRYEQIADAYCDGLETRLARGETLANVTSVASVHVHAIDAWADRALERVADARQGGAGGCGPLLRRLSVSPARNSLGRLARGGCAAAATVLGHLRDRRASFPRGPGPSRLDEHRYPHERDARDPGQASR